MKSKNAFAEWINEVGINTVATLLKVNSRTVRYWLEGHSFPRVEQMKLIGNLSKGNVGYSDILERADLTSKKRRA